MKRPLFLIALAAIALASPSRADEPRPDRTPEQRFAAAFPFSFWKTAGGGTPTPTPDPNPITRAYVSDGDANGVLYFAGQNFSTAGTWTNPHTAGRVTVTRSSDIGFGPEIIVDRATGGDGHTSNAAGSWIATDLGASRSAVLTKYSLRNRSPYGDRPMRNWKLQGSNNPASNSVANLAAATWTDIDTRVGDTAMPATTNAWATYTISGTPAAYRWFRILQNGVNGLGDHYLVFQEWEIYGTLTY